MTLGPLKKDASAIIAPERDSVKRPLALSLLVALPSIIRHEGEELVTRLLKSPKPPRHTPAAGLHHPLFAAVLTLLYKTSLAALFPPCHSGFFTPAAAPCLCRSIAASAHDERRCA